MITNKGNEIITKYLLGQAPEYAAYIAVGVGSKPLLLEESDTSLPTKKSMDFEAFRVPVTSRGIVNDTITLDLSSLIVSSNVGIATTSTRHGINVGDSVTLSFTTLSNDYEGIFEVITATSNSFTYNQSSNINGLTSVANTTWTSSSGNTGNVTYVRDRMIFKAQLPPDQKYSMTEVAIYPAINNQLALGFDSKLLSTFLPTEGWTLYDSSNVEIEFTTSSITEISGTGNIDSDLAGLAKFINSDNSIFSLPERVERYESPRLYNRCLIVSGDLTSFTNDSMDLPVSPRYVISSNIKFDASKNSPNDYIKIALSVLSEDKISLSVPAKARIRIEFIDSSNQSKAIATELITDAELSISRYQIISKKFSDFTISDPSFSWARVGAVAIYVQTLNGSNAYDGSYVALDGIRIDNENTPNPLYAMICYSKLKNSQDDGMPIEKVENSQGYIEYRMGVSIF